MRLLLAQLGLAYHWVELDILRGENRTASFLTKNPDGRIPTLVADLVRSKVPPDQVAAWLAQHIPQTVGPRHHEKFLADVIAELKHLDVSRIAGLGLTREELETWLKLCSQL